VANDIKAVISIIMCVSLAIAGFFAYNYIYNRGYEQAHLACEQAKQELQQQLQQKITTLEQSLSETQARASEQQDRLGRDIGKISKLLKNQPVTVIENGRCLPSEVFVDSINQAILRANEK
jgi:uncharacterized protein YlxW (UPF0749 family)